MIGSYDTPQAFRAALEARLRNIAQQEGTDLQRLQRRVAFERLLARLFVGDAPPWMLKGGYARVTWKMVFNFGSGHPTAPTCPVAARAFPSRPDWPVGSLLGFTWTWASVTRCLTHPSG